MTLHRYSVYGVSLSSDIPFDFPEAPPAPGTPHVRFLRAGGWERPETACEDLFVCRPRDDGSVYLRWAGLFEFLVDDSGRRVEYNPLAGGTPAILQNFLFGQTLSFALIRQNVEPIHAAVVDLGGRAIALLGDCTYGKSTLAAAMLKAGCRLVSDDLLVVRRSHRVVMARPGTGRIKLHADSAAAMLPGAGHGERLIPNADKRVFRLDPAFVQPAEVPLEAFLVLPTPDAREASDRITMAPLAGADVFRELVANTFVRYVDDARRLQQNFASNAHLASVIPGFRLSYPSGIARLPEVVAAVAHHLAPLTHEDRS